MTPLRVALCGNPNVGKSTVFNALTGLRQHTGNWAGKTVESARGQVSDPEGDWELVDLPGAYSLLNGSPEEMVASEYLAFERLDAVIVVCDAGCLERTVNLALQVARVCPRTVLCVNMLDEARRHGVEIDGEKLESLTGLATVLISARGRKGLDALKERVRGTAASARALPPLGPEELSLALEKLSLTVERLCPGIAQAGTRRLAALCAMAGGRRFRERLMAESSQPGSLQDAMLACRMELERLGYDRNRLVCAWVADCYDEAETLCRETVSVCHEARGDSQLRADRLLANRWVGIPLMLCLLAGVLYLTLLGANVPSAWLNRRLAELEPWLGRFLAWLRSPEWLTDLLISGVWRVTAWVVSVMLPPMAIFFPLFTLLEDAGLLPRVAFHLDHCFERCHACGKQALCMCMGLGCNAVGVMGCRIIQSPRERLIALLTNSLMPCNGRFPTLILLIGMFGVAGDGPLSALWGAVCLVGLLVLCVLVTLLSSYGLSKTVLAGLPSAFSLELPPFRRPQIGQVLVRSVLDRTLFVLGRAVCVAAPAGAAVWLLAHFGILPAAAAALHPLGRLLGMDGAILLAFVLGFPANELVLPLLMMIYLNQTSLTELAGMETLRSVFLANGWTLTTAACVTLFTLFHWPCSTTLITVWRETKSAYWTLAAFLLPLGVGCALCAVVALLG